MCGVFVLESHGSMCVVYLCCSVYDADSLSLSFSLRATTRTCPPTSTSPTLGRTRRETSHTTTRSRSHAPRRGPPYGAPYPTTPLATVRKRSRMCSSSKRPSGGSGKRGVLVLVRERERERERESDGEHLTTCYLLQYLDVLVSVSECSNRSNQHTNLIYVPTSLVLS